MNDQETRSIAEIRWSLTMQQHINMGKREGRLIYLDNETPEGQKAGYHLTWIERTPLGEEVKSMYLGSHLALVQYNIDQWVKVQRGFITDGKYR